MTDQTLRIGIVWQADMVGAFHCGHQGFHSEVLHQAQ